MKRIVVIISAALLVSGMWACGPAPKACAADTLLDKAQLCSDKDSIGFAQEFGSGTFIGQAPIESLAIKNGGLEDLTISSVTTTGDAEFKYTASWDDNTTDNVIPPTTVKGNKSVVIQVSFAPKTNKQYSGSVTINTNAQNSASKTFTISGCGVPTDGGTSPCYRDGGR